MEKAFIIVVMVVLNFECICQEKTKAWLPEKYVMSVLSKDTSANIYLSPFEGLEFHSDSIYILLFRGELNPVKVKKVIIDGKEKTQLQHLQFFVNLKYNPKELADKLSKAVIYMSKVNDKLLLEIIIGDKIEEIYFIDRICDYEFISIKKSLQHIDELN